jgi:hypothetical protein
MLGWSRPVVENHVRFIFTAEPVERLATIPERFAGATLASRPSAPNAPAQAIYKQ